MCVVLAPKWFPLAVYTVNVVMCRAALASRSSDLTPALVASVFEQLQSHVFVSITDALFCSVALEVGSPLLCWVVHVVIVCCWGVLVTETASLPPAPTSKPACLSVGLLSP